MAEDYAGMMRVGSVCSGIGNAFAVPVVRWIARRLALTAP
jgi:site-specific DNA-cytosine methylase